jgi:flagellar biosynthetic protein FliR
VIATPAAFDLFAPGSAEALVLMGARVSGLFLIAPVFSGRQVPMMVRAALIVLFTVLLQPAALASAGAVPAITAPAVTSEVLVGFGIGLGAAVLIGAAELAGDLMTIQMGLSGAALLDPLSNTTIGVLGTFTQLMALTLILAVNGHLVMLDAIAASARALPIGTPLNAASGIASMLSMGGTLFSVGLRFAAPVIAAVLVANVALAVLSRAAPQLNILSVAFPVQIGIGLFALVAALPFIAAYLTDFDRVYDGLLTHMARGFTALPAGAR